MESEALNALNESLNKIERQALSALKGIEQLRKKYGIEKRSHPGAPNSFELFLVRKVCGFYGIDPDQFWIKLKVKRHKFYEARAMVVLFLRDEMRYTTTSIGRILDKDHTTILNAYEKAEDFMLTDGKFRDSFWKLQAMFKEKSA